MADFLSEFGQAVEGVPKQLGQWGKDVGGAVEGLFTDPLAAAKGVPGEIEANVHEVEHLFDDATGGGSTPATDKKPPKAKDPRDNTQYSQGQLLGGAISSMEAPLNNELAALPSEYTQAVSGMTSGANAVPKSGNASLDAALASTTNALQAGEGGVQKALAAEGPAAATAEADLPYSDILSTALTQRKNELLYGTPASSFTQGVDTSHWSTGLQNIYKYIQGGAASNSTLKSTGGGDTIPTPQQAAAGAATGQVPGPQSFSSGP